jgi:uroporphyrinogen-III synthase
MRHGGTNLAALKLLPVHAVGAATAAAARDAGFHIETVGSGNASELLASLPASLRLLHLAGVDRHEASDGQLDVRIVYRSIPIETPDLPSLDGRVAAVHSSRAAARLAELAGNRNSTSIAAISAAAAAACGSGWERVDIAEQSNDSSLLALAAMLCHTSPPT